MTDYIATDLELTSIADAIRTAGGTSAQLEFPTGFVSAIGNLGGGEAYPVVGDGKTYLHIQVTDLLRPTVEIRFTQTVARGVSVDWGDSSAAETYTGTSAATHSHTYAEAGEYTIALDCTSGYIQYGGSAANSLFVTNSTTGGNGVKRTRLVAAEIGSHGIRDTSLNSYAFAQCYQLQKVTLPEGITSIGVYAFQNCSSLHTVNIPSTVTVINNYAFYACFSLREITIPSGVTNLGSTIWYNNYSLQKVTVPASVTNIGAAMWQNCWSVKEYHIKPTTPPTLGNTSAFTNIPTDCVIYVPSGSLSAYQAANNWSTYASKMQGE